MRTLAILCALLITGLGLHGSAFADDYFVGSVPVYQLHFIEEPESDITGTSFTSMLDSFLANSPEEISTAVGIGWTNEGIGLYISPAQIPGTVALHRLYNPGLTDHICTASFDEMQVFKAQGFQYEGIMGYVFPASNVAPGTVPLHRFHQASQTLHAYSTNPAAGGSMAYEGVTCRVWPTQQRLVTMAIKAPTTAEELRGSSTYTVSWSSSRQGGYVSLSYTIDDGISWLPIETGLENTGSTAWKVPNVDSADARLRITWTDAFWGPTNVLASVESPHDFRIKKVALAPGVRPVGAFRKVASPTSLFAKIASPSSILVTWIASSGEPAGYIVERRAGTGRFMQVANVKAPEVKYTDNFVSPATSYVYRVIAYNQGAFSGHSQTASVVTAHAFKKRTKPGTAVRPDGTKKK